MDFKNMSKDEAIKYCYDNEDKYIRGFEDISEGQEEFDGIIVLLEMDGIKPSELPDYGMDF